MKITLVFLILVTGIASAVGNSRHERRQSKENVAREKRQNTVNANWGGNQRQQYISSPRAASFAPEYYQTFTANPGSNSLSRSRDSYVQGARRSAANRASIGMNAANKVRHNFKNVSAMTSEKRVPMTDKSEDLTKVPPAAMKGSRKSTTPFLVPGSKRSSPVRLNSPAAAAAAADVQGAVVEKGIEVMGKMVDKQLQIIDEAQEKAENFLKKEIKLDITPEKGWQSEDMFVPPGYHLDSTITDDGGSPKEAEPTAYTYPAGLGNVLMNGCYGTGYKEGDPCYVAKWTLDACLNMIDGAAFMGVGFDGRGEYSPESRKMSIVQRSCAGKATYDDLDVPDTMNVHGIYDTKASMRTFEGRSEFQSYLQEEAGVSGSYFGFYAGVKSAWGESKSGASQKYMALLSVGINRYEIFLDEVKPQDLSLSFLREFMDLPTSYFAAGAPLKYQNFIQRWGTHYIKSSKFGGQLQIRKFMDATDVSNKKEFAVEMEMEFKTLFSSVGAKSSTAGGEYSRNQSKTTSTAVIALGGSHEVAAILSDAYSPTFKSAFKEWLVSIPKYPKPFLFQVGSITNLINFRMRDLFPDEKVNWGCEGHAASLKTETNANGDKVTFFETVGENGTTVKHYCTFESRKGLEEAIKRRRISLKRAIEVYMEEGPTAVSDFTLPECTSPAQEDSAKRTINPALSWQKITNGQREFRVIFDMKDDLNGIEGYRIPRAMSRLVKHTDGKWVTGEEDGSFHLYNAFNNGGSGDVKKRKLSILGLVLSYNQNTGGLELLPADLEASKQFFPTLHDFLGGRTLAKIAMQVNVLTGAASKRETMAKPPCNVKWSNALRFDPTDSNGKCLHFTAITEGSLFVAFSALPKDTSSWYYTEITPEKVAIYKGKVLKTSTTNPNARGLGDPNLLQSYFVCVTESESTTLIEYGKTMGTTESGDIYLNMLDVGERLNVRFYAFGNGDKKLDVIDAHIVSRDMTKADCKGDTHMDLETRLCTQRCHEDCDPLHGCQTASSGDPLPTECNVCRVAKDPINGRCLPECKEPHFLTPDHYCIDRNGTFDIQPKGTASEIYYRSGMAVSGIHQLPSLTMCLWHRLLNLFVGVPWTLASYTVSGSKPQYFRLIWLAHDDGNQMSLAVEQKLPNGEPLFSKGRILSKPLMEEKTWHHFCVTFSGESGVVMVYVDGVKKISETMTPQELDGGGVLRTGEKWMLLYQVTGLNLWDKVLPPEEITELSTSCLKGIGNVKNWFDFSDTAKASTSTVIYRGPSTCQPPAQKGTVTQSTPPPQGSEGGTTGTTE